LESARGKEEEERRGCAASTWGEDTAVAGKEGLVAGGFCSAERAAPDFCREYRAGVEEHDDFDAGDGVEGAGDHGFGVTAGVGKEG